jgi:hypothetical protein
MANDWQVLFISVLTAHPPRETYPALETRDEIGLQVQRLILPEATSAAAECDLEAAKEQVLGRSYCPLLKRTVLGYTSSCASLVAAGRFFAALFSPD